MPPKVPGEWELEEPILTLRALADVVDDPGALAAVWGGDDEGDVGQFASDRAGDEVIVDDDIHTKHGVEGQASMECRLSYRDAGLAVAVS
jgi:hypothetical protein